MAWVTGITCIRTRQGWLYLAAVLDLFSRKVVGWAVARAEELAPVRQVPIHHRAESLLVWRPQCEEGL